MYRISLLALAVITSGCATSIKQQQDLSWVTPINESLPKHRVYGENTTFARPIFDYVDPNVQVVIPGKTLITQNTQPISSELDELRQKIAELELLTKKLEGELRIKSSHIAKVNIENQAPPVITKNKAEIDENTAYLPVGKIKAPEETPNEELKIQASVAIKDEDPFELEVKEVTITGNMDIVSIFTDKVSAMKLMEKLNLAGEKDFFMSQSSAKGEWYVYLGRYNKISDALKRVDHLESLSIDELVIASNNERYSPSEVV